MPYVIAQPCVDVMDRSCIDECPVDCIHEGGRVAGVRPASARRGHRPAAYPVRPRALRRGAGSRDDETVTRVLAGWLRLEEYEGALGAANGRGRVKVHDLESMLRHCAVSV
jgi:NAD-dependent dihydropyrimidine dehydrogenase PreA subunit